MVQSITIKTNGKEFAITDSDGQADILLEWLLSNTTLTYSEYKLAKQNEEENTCIISIAA
jgi:hypothetical protein